MSERYLVTHVPHFIGGVMVHPGYGDKSIVTLPPGVKPGRWLVPVDAEPADSLKFKARHNGPGVGAGNWAVENVEDGSRASVVFKKADGEAKEKAEAEAARLNAGGEIVLVITDDALSSGQDDPPTSASSDQLPDA